MTAPRLSNSPYVEGDFDKRGLQISYKAALQLSTSLHVDGDFDEARKRDKSAKAPSRYMDFDAHPSAPEVYMYIFKKTPSRVLSI